MTYEGAVPAEKVGDVLSCSDLFFLPTRGENFGHVFVESWAAGVPVLTSDQTPWRDLERQGVGWDLPLGDASAFARVIDDAARWSAEQRAEYRDRCLRFAEHHVRSDSATEDNRRMFSGIVRGDERA
jgi:glycosyltransferase involved in cell wall biosynthesis